MGAPSPASHTTGSQAHQQECDALYAEAAKLHAAGDRQAAEARYRAVLKLSPKHADAQHMLGALLIQLYGDKKFEEGRLLVQSAINAVPSCAKYRKSLGVLLQACGKHQEAVDAFERANEKDPMNVQTLMHLARELKETNRFMRAAEVYRSVTLLEPDHPKAHYQRAACLRTMGRRQEALASLRQHQRLFPDDEQTRFWIAAVSGDAAAMQAMPSHLVSSLFDQYADHFDDHLVNHLQYRTPQLLMDALLAAQTSSSADVSASPASTKPAAAAAVTWQRAVDLGCGTGLMGPLLRPYVRVLEGVDLSAAMVDKAREKGCYDRLEVGELVAHIEQNGMRHGVGTTCTAIGGDRPAPPAAASDSDVAGRDGAAASASQASTEATVAVRLAQDDKYSLLVAADVFVYIGSLAPVMESAARHSRAGALFAFSVESLESWSGAGPGGDKEQSSSSGSAAGAADPSAAHGCVASGSSSTGSPDGAACQGYALAPSGRYAHSRAYLHEVGASSGWRVQHLSGQVLRRNEGKPVHGHLCVMELAGEQCEQCEQ